jgi:hypothetical protein
MEIAASGGMVNQFCRKNVPLPREAASNWRSGKKALHSYGVRFMVISITAQRTSMAIHKQQMKHFPESLVTPHVG